MKKTILIDARLYGPTKTGIGRYTKNLLLALTKLKSFSQFEFHLLTTQSDFSDIKNLFGDKFIYHPTAIAHYSFSEQFWLPSFIKKIKPDLVHFTHFNKPLFYQGLSLITIHDLIKHYFRGKETTTKPSLLYWPKYLAYLIVTKINILQNFIIVPSNFWRDILIHQFQLNPQKITTTYEAVDPDFINSQQPSTTPQNYIIYTGNLYPHKNIDVILNALAKMPDITLKIISPVNHFFEKLKKKVTYLNLTKQVEFLGFVPDSKFSKIYSRALCLVHPAFMEGFSLTGLEAMSLNCPVISSNYSCLPEIYKDAAIYFNPKDPNDLATKIRQLQDNSPLRHNLITKGKKLLKTYSWQKTAFKTMSVYEKILRQT